ncbi:hypothetical protein B2G71_17540 [Novosphingobium sp. PC22D]|uniref:MFS transporter n=1 Tax=Novosphingobium sp. PC22D TaxID=1962403 RepID=UPI000BEFC261|nr:MFS transporter [Novosphingobium sp. PC22D]PEQ11357.1 hypothetical protein B2G71_17540 [Novosphingobium sp. PC22D]
MERQRGTDAMADYAVITREVSPERERGEFARGWPVLVASSLGIGLGMSPLFMFTSGVFAVALEREFGWSRAEILGAAAFDTLAILMVGPLVGRLNDRIGARPVALFSCAAIGLMTIALALTSSHIWVYYLLYATRSALSVGTLPPTFAKVVGAWFDKKRGMALGIALCTTGISGALLPPYVQSLVDAVGWRMAYVGLGLLPLIFALPAIAMLLPRGGPPRHAAMAGRGREAAGREIGGLEVREALFSYRFWAMGLLTLAAAVGLGGVLSNLVPMLVDRGFSLGEAAAQMSLYGVVIVFGRLVSGWLLDRFWAPGVGFVFLVSPCVGALLLATVADTGILVAVAVVMIALASGAEFDLVAFLTSRYFGQRNFSTLYAAQYAFFGLGAGLSPALFGAVHDLTDTYTNVLYMAAGLFLFSAVGLLTLGRYPDFAKARD